MVVIEMTIPYVFIIESLTFKDEEGKLFEGDFISQMLHLSGSRSRYVYIRTKKELKKVVDQFKNSDYRYLHISCHGNKKGIGLTLDNLSFEQLGEILRPVLKKRRIFFSSCEVMNQKLAKELLNRSGCISVIGPSKTISFDRAAMFWASFYHLMLRDEARSMKRSKLTEIASQLQGLFGVRIRYFSTSNKSGNGFHEINLVTNSQFVGQSRSRHA